MTLAQRLSEIRHAFESGDTPPEVIAVLNAHTEQLVASGVSSQALSVGSAAPSGLVPSEDGPKSLEEYMGPRSLVVTWFRGNW